MKVPPYFKQEKSHTCSIAVLRMVLAAQSVFVSEEELAKNPEIAYEKKFKNIKNESIAALGKSCGLRVEFIKLTEESIKKFLDKSSLIQTSIKLRRLYPHKKGFHSLLLYGYSGDKVFYHDPSYGEALNAPFNTLLKATVGSAILYNFLTT